MTYQFLKLGELGPANELAQQMSEFSKHSKSQPDLPEEVVEEQGKFYVKIALDFNYGDHPYVVANQSNPDYVEVVQKLPSEILRDNLEYILANGEEWAKKKMDEFKNENMQMGIALPENMGKADAVMEIMCNKYVTPSCAMGKGVSLFDAMATGTLTTAYAVCLVMAADIDANPGNYSHAAPWITKERIEKYAADILAFLQEPVV